MRVEIYLKDDLYKKLNTLAADQGLKNVSAAVRFLIETYQAPNEEPSLLEMAPSYDTFPVLRERYNDLVIAGKIDEAKAVRRICDDIESRNSTEAQYLAQEANNDPEEPF